MPLAVLGAKVTEMKSQGAVLQAGEGPRAVGFQGPEEGVGEEQSLLSTPLCGLHFSGS